MLNVVLYQPEIPANTGNIGRTCVLTGARLHLVGPLGFSIDDASLRRAGLAYWGGLDVQSYQDWDQFLSVNPDLERDVAPEQEARELEPRVLGPHAVETHALGPHVHLLTKTAKRTYAASHYQDGDWLIFGKESTGLPLELLHTHPDLCERIPMLGDNDALGEESARAWHTSHEHLHPELRRDVAGNYVDERAGKVASLNLSNAVAIVLYEALRQLNFPGMDA